MDFYRTFFTRDIPQEQIRKPHLAALLILSANQSIDQSINQCYSPFHCYLGPFSRGMPLHPPLNFLHHLLLPKYPPHRRSQPLSRHPHPTSIFITNPSYINRIGGWDFFLLHFLWGLAVAVFLGCDFRGGDFSATFGGLFFEEAVYGVHLLVGIG